MTLVAQLALGLWIGLGLLAFAAWSIRVYATTELHPKPDWTTWAIYTFGRGCVWLAIVLAVSSVAGVVIFAVVRALSGA